ncbi:P27 family phage terminase small subunit [Castellaniella sp.]|uniref:P27 family phage terminase small subunit n=1 Tax=Castellaniella sp. TaxID=1955812 RepID=UPI003A94DCED
MSGASVQAIPSEIPTPPSKLSAKEKKVWTHVTTALHECGLVHLTDAMALTVICRTFVRWVEAEEALDQLTHENGGTYIVATPNGYEQPHQLFFVVRSLKKELLQWLPEAALTIPSFAKAIETRQAPVQGTLFEDPVEAHRRRKTALGIRAV